MIFGSPSKFWNGFGLITALGQFKEKTYRIDSGSMSLFLVLGSYLFLNSIIVVTY